MSRTGSLWPATLALALCLGLIPTVAAPRVQAQEDEDQGGAKKQTIRVYPKEGDSDEDAGQGYLGVQVQDLTRSLRRAMDLEGVDGALVNSVADGSPAENAGIRKGDVIIRVNRTDTPGAGELTRAVRGLKSGEKTSVVVVRDGDRRTLTVVLGTRPKDDEFEVRLPGGGRWQSGDEDAMPPGGFMLRHQQAMEKEMQDLREEISKLTEEIRQLRLQLQRDSSHR
jgi:membrane-associated protease RseP (regulator of RpoE activity)